MKKYNLEELVLSHILAKKTTTTLAIVETFTKRNFTKQGVYKALHRLHKETKIIWIKTHIEIHLLWVHREIERLADVLPKKEIIFEQFTEKKKAYRVRNLIELENVYGQLFISLISSTPSATREFLFYDIHNYTYVNTVPIVDWYIDFIFRNQGNAYLLVGSKSPLDLALKKEMKTIQVHCIDKKWNTNLSIIDDYIISVTHSKRVVDKLDRIFETKNISDARDPLQAVYHERSSHKITVEKNKEKATKIRNEFKKYFALT